MQGRYPPWGRPFGLGMGLTMVILTSETIRPDDEHLIELALRRPRRARAVPLAFFRINAGQNAMALGVAGGLDDLFLEPSTLADSFRESFRRFVPRIDFGMPS